MAKIHAKNGSLVFADATFYACPAIAYQLFITRIFDIKYDSFYTTSFSLMRGKSTEDYLIIFKKLDEHISIYSDINENYRIKELHTDFESAIGTAAKIIYPEIQIKYCIWHQKRALENKKNSLCKSDISNNDNLFILYKAICNLYLCDPEYIVKVFKIIRQKSNNINFNKFLDYYEEEYFKVFNISNWNYYRNYRHITNNACEANNSKINKLFDGGPSFFKLVYELRVEESSIITNYNKRIAGLIGHELRRNIKVEEQLRSLESTIEEINDMPSVSNFEKNLVAWKWFDCLSKFRYLN